ncbi:WXG100 family type VII secretion target [Natronoglycomyces albus]|uniref:WXG100 family type VII secretion target n=1 Tax=Natronoglycomyces albus TaxID=2811108 RepID=A0A895XR94_9ACTN|nr:hypothetical protein [Natronoglycomyces albus]QSB04118.1 hypothetical protein JQS30_09855 [Natronoglycomyces albus]
MSEALDHLGTAAANTPVVKHVWSAGNSVYDAWGDPAQLTAAAADAATSGWALYSEVKSLGGWLTDPIGNLAGLGVDMLLAFVQPIQDLIHLVTGDPGSMADAARVWDDVGASLQEAGSYVVEAGESNLGDTYSLDVLVARGALGVAGTCLSGLTVLGFGVKMLLTIAQCIATLAYEIIKMLLSQLVKHLIISGLVALATAKITLGGSLGKFLAWAKVQSANTYIKAGGKYDATQSLMENLGGAVQEEVTKMFGENLNKTLFKITNSTIKDTVLTVLPESATGESSVSSPQGTGSGGGALSILINPEGLRQASADVNHLAGEVDGIVSRSNDAGTSDITWGVVGIPWAAGYFAASNAYRQLIKTSASALEVCSSTLDHQAEAWQSVEDTITQVFDDYDEEISVSER